MTANSLLKNLLHIKGAVVDSFDLGENAKGEPSLVVHVHVSKGLRWRCPVCGNIRVRLARRSGRGLVVTTPAVSRSSRSCPC